MPAVKKLFPESENQKNPEYISGHMFVGIGVLIGGIAKWFYLPLHINLQDGMDTILSWNKENKEARTHVVQMIENAYEATVPALEALKQCNDKVGTPMHLVTKAKRSYTAYEFPGPKKPGRGRSPKKRKSVKIRELFSKESSQFVTAETTIYGKKETVRYYCINLLWGQ